MATGPGLFTVVCNHLKPTMLLRVARPGAFENWGGVCWCVCCWCVCACMCAGWGPGDGGGRQQGGGLGWADRSIDRSMGLRMCRGGFATPGGAWSRGRSVDSNDGMNPTD